MGVTIRQKTKGKGEPWWVFITHNGKRTSRRVGSKSAAREVAAKIQAKLKLGEYNFEKGKPTPTFKNYADLWVKTTVPATCKRSTAKDYEDILRIHVLPIFKDIRITDVTRGKIKDFLFERANRGYAGSTVTHMKNVISGILNKVVDDEIIPANPAHRLGKVIKTKDRNQKIDPLISDELNLLLNAAQKHFPEHYPMFLLLARTGMGIGEALGRSFWCFNLKLEDPLGASGTRAAKMHQRRNDLPKPHLRAQPLERGDTSMGKLIDLREFFKPIKGLYGKIF